MNAVKDDLIRMIQSLPDDCTAEDIQYHLYVREKVLRGQAAADAGDVVSQAEAERMVQQWATLSGQTPH
jgi:predicted transcriptional regulator